MGLEFKTDINGDPIPRVPEGSSNDTAYIHNSKKQIEIVGWEDFANSNGIPSFQTNTINVKDVPNQTYDITEDDEYYLINVNYDGDWNINLPNINLVNKNFEIYISHKQNENSIGSVIPYSSDSVHGGGDIGMVGKGLLNIKKIKIDENNFQWFLSNQEKYNSSATESIARRIDFENENNIQVQHNLGFIPIVQVWVEDGAGGFVEANVDIDHDWSEMNSFEVQLNSIQSGKIIY
tara:strand:+ start:15 stop:719 length:705 start_codon:yes stop_codon:yes gene_type:complete